MKTRPLFYLIFFLLLAVLLPHTAWWFGQFEPDSALGAVSSWLAAVAFEAAIAVFTYKLAKHIEANFRKGREDWRRRVAVRYLNPYGLGLLAAWAVSTVANYAHAIEFGRQVELFGRLNLSPEIGAVMAGGILPLCSLLFARAISEDTETEQVEDVERTTLNAEIRRLKSEKNALEKQLQGANRYSFLGSANKTEIIREAAELWPQLPQTALAILADASKSHVSSVLSGPNGTQSTENET